MRRKLTTAAGTLLAATLVGLAGCSSATPVSGTSSVTASVMAHPFASGSSASSASASSASASSASASSASAPSASSPSASAGSVSLPGLSTSCAAAVRAQSDISDLFGRAVDGTKLTTADVTTTFDAMAADMPADLGGDMATLRDAATRSVGKSTVEVAEILQEKQVTAARQALSRFVQGCTPPTS